MAGHSHWHSIRYKKERADAKRSQIFSKLSRMITIAAREGGGDPELNPRLALAIERAKDFNMPAENIEKAIKKGTGEIEAEKIEEVLYEGYGPGGIAVIVEAITDNKNRTFTELKQLFSQFGGKIVESGSVRWMFERKGVITLNLNQEKLKEFPAEEKKEKLELMAIEAGADDIYWHQDKLDIYLKPEKIKEVKAELAKKGLVIEEISLDWVPKNYQDVSQEEKEKIRNFFELLDENDAVQDIYSNLKNSL